MSKPVAIIEEKNTPSDEQNLFPTVMTANIKTVLPSSKHNATAPQIDLEGVDFFALAKQSAQPSQKEEGQVAGDGQSNSGSSFSSSILSRSHLQKLGAHDPAGDTPQPKLKKPKLLVLRGERVDVQYTIYPGKNYIGRTDDKPVDIDLENQEPSDRIWSSRQHAIINFENGQISIEDLNSLNGTFVNRSRIGPNAPKLLQENDVVQIGTVQLKLILS